MSIYRQKAIPRASCNTHAHLEDTEQQAESAPPAQLPLPLPHLQGAAGEARANVLFFSFFFVPDSLVFVAEHHPGEADAQAEGRQQQHGDVRPLLQVRQVVLRDPAGGNTAPAVNKRDREKTLGWTRFHASYLHLQKGSLRTNGHRQLWRPTEEATQKMTMTQMAAAAGGRGGGEGGGNGEKQGAVVIPTASAFTPRVKIFTPNLGPLWGLKTQ